MFLAAPLVAASETEWDTSHMRDALDAWRTNADPFRGGTSLPPATQPDPLAGTLWARLNGSIHALHLEIEKAREDVMPPPSPPAPPQSPALSPCWWRSGRTRAPIGVRCEDLIPDATWDRFGHPENETDRAMIPTWRHQCNHAYLIGTSNRTASGLVAFDSAPNSAPIDASPSHHGPDAVLFSKCGFLDEVQLCITLPSEECAGDPSPPPAITPPSPSRPSRNTPTGEHAASAPLQGAYTYVVLPAALH